MTDQLAAYGVLTSYATTSTDPNHDPVLQSFDASSFAKHVYRVQI